jgi:lipopolysaccharide/colanic/teichoic acid biosynthesis glycosyltransferase
MHDPMELLANTEPLTHPQPRPSAAPRGTDRARHIEREVVIGTITPRPAASLEVSGGVGARTSLLTPTADVRLDLGRRTAVPTVAPRERSEAVSRAVNFTIALVALVVLAPVLLLVALVIKLTSPGPVFYTQVRVGQDRRGRRGELGDDRRREDCGGRPFTIFKFRSMRVDAEANGQAVWARADDDRVTPVGRFLRRSRIDELPQLFNVLRGEMNIVGPRPERPCIFARLRNDIAEYPLRQLAKPGITGWAQINHTYDTCVEDVRTKVRYDLEYLQRQSLAEDLKIMVMTVPVMIFRKGGW